ncbi:MAG: DUF721 domain-containing protein [Chromatiaceae bacterium]|nr:MAG: DUF721 domain-containing protein [Chromatiaceae bacterium]
MRLSGNGRIVSPSSRLTWGRRRTPRPNQRPSAAQPLRTERILLPTLPSLVMTVSHLRGHLRKNEAIAALLIEIEQREALLSTIRAALPAPLAGHCQQAAVAAGRLTLIVDSPVWVDRLRFIAPQLIDAVRRTGAEVATCRVRAVPLVGPPNASGRADEAGHSFTPTLAATCLRQAAADVGDSALGQALRRLATTCNPSAAIPPKPTPPAR